MATKNKTIVLAYSGGLDTSVAIKWLADRYDSEIVNKIVEYLPGKQGLLHISEISWSRVEKVEDVFKGNWNRVEIVTDRVWVSDFWKK